MHHDDDETLQRVEDGEEDLEEGGAAVGDGQDGGHPGEGQEGQNHARAPQRCSEGWGGEGKKMKMRLNMLTQAAVGSLFLCSCCLIVQLDIKAHHQYTCNSADEGVKRNTPVCGRRSIRPTRLSPSASHR